MKEKQFMKARNLLLQEKKALNVRFRNLLHEFIDANSPVKQGKVYIIRIPKIKKLGYDRFYVYTVNVASRYAAGIPAILAKGWWIDNNKAVRWDEIIVYELGHGPRIDNTDDQYISFPLPAVPEHHRKAHPFTLKEDL